MDKRQCHDLPKIELHAHLNGSVSIDTLKYLRTLNQRNGEPQIDDKTWKQWERMFVGSEIPTLSQCFEIFKVAHSITTTPKAVQIATERVIEDFAKDNVIYLELRSTLRNESKMTKIQYLEAMIAGVKNCQAQLPNITVKLIVSLNRRNSLQEAEENVDLAIKYSKMEPDIVVGIDLSGDPNEKKFTDYIPVLNKARHEGLKLTIHFAEVPGNVEILDVLKFRPDRLGHGTCVHEKYGGSMENWKLLLERKIPMEVCVTSNVKCKTVPSVEEHHFSLLHKANHPVVICTDDKSVFQTTLSTEYETVKTAFDLSINDLWHLSHDAIDYTFADETLKSRLRDVLVTWRNANIK